MPVGRGNHCRDVLLAPRIRCSKRALPTAPGQAIKLEVSHQQEVGERATMAPVTVGERMNCSKPVMQADRQLELPRFRGQFSVLAL
jgi:hypothetical protein